MADEANHRDVNHTFADMQTDDPNPFIEQHRENAAFAWRLNRTGEDAWHLKDSTSATSQPGTNTTSEPAASTTNQQK
jgi:hypothetical protein